MAETPVFHVQLTFGPMLIGVFLNMILYGILITQMHFYYQNFLKSDSIWIKLLVAYLFIVETANTALDMAMIYQPLIAEYGTQKAVDNFPTLFMSEPIVIVLISAPIQTFFAWRIHKITQSYLIPFIIVLLSLASSAGGFITGIKIVILKLFVHKPELHWSALLWFIPACLADIIITVTLVRTLSKRKTGFGGTDSAIDKLIRITVQTGMLTAICAIGDVLFFMALPHTALNFIWDLALSKLYTNCLMSTLNARQDLWKTSRSQGSSLVMKNSRQADTDLRFAHSARIYEHDSRKTAPSQAASLALYRGNDPEYGVSVTQVPETREDPSLSSNDTKISMN